jgi:MerR family transcriptional regulator/heat shock protein HspR
MAVAADLLGLDNQTLRRLGDVISQQSARPSGNQRRYSRRDLQALADAAALTRQSYGGPAIARILELERQVHALSNDAAVPSGAG